MQPTASTDRLLRQMSTATEPDELLRVILADVHRDFGFDQALVLTRAGLERPCFRLVLQAVHHGTGTVDVLHGPEETLSGGPIADLLYDSRFEAAATLTLPPSDPMNRLLDGSRRVTVFPLYESGEATGMVLLTGRSAHTVEPAVMNILAFQGALLQRASREHELWRNLQATCKLLDAELAAAAEVQRWLLPVVRQPQPGVDVASLYQPACHAGGDYYDLGPLSDHRLGVMIADVSGHGAAAAVLMAITRTVVHDGIDRSGTLTPAALLDYTDERLCGLGLSARGAFVTAFCGSLDSVTGQFTYSAAGHPPPRLVRKGPCGVHIQPITDASDLPLGVLIPPDRSFREDATVQLQPGDLVVLYSDGVTEARSPTGAFFGEARLDGVLRDLPPESSPQFAVETIRRALYCFSGGSRPLDDQTLLVIRWLGSAGRRSAVSHVPPDPQSNSSEVAPARA